MSTPPIRDRDTALARMRQGSRIPAILAPMYRVSGPDLVVAGCRAGMISAFPTQTPVTTIELAAWIEAVRVGLADSPNPSARWGVSMIAHSTYARFEEELALVVEAKPAFVVTALGSPRRALDAVHGYGGLVFADVASVRLARKAADAGADGLVLVCSGAGGQTGTANPFAFVGAVRRFFDGIIVLAGSIATGPAIRAAEIMGADFAYVGTPFIPTRESLADKDHKAGVLAAELDDIVTTSVVTGVPGTFTRQSLIDAGFDLEGAPRDVDFARAFDGAPRPRAHAAGHGVGAATHGGGAASLTGRLIDEYRAACASTGSCPE